MAWGTRTGVTDLLERLKQPATAKSLYVLSIRKITEADTKTLADAIASNTQLEELYLSGHRLGPDGLSAFAACLAANTTLKHVSVGEDSLGDEGVARLCQGISQNPNTALQIWDLEYKSISVAGANAIGELLATNTKLQTLNLSRNAIGSEGVEKIVAGLKKNELSALQELVMTDAELTGDALKHLAAVVESPSCSLQVLQLSFNGLGGESGLAFFQSLAKNHSLKKLYLKECALTDAHIAALGQSLATNASLVEIDLSDNQLTPTACESLAGALASNKTLRSLTLGNNKCQDAGAQHLGRVLSSSNTSLVFLDLSNNELTHAGMTGLLASPSITNLQLFNNALKEGLTHLLPALAANTVIQTLNVGANGLHGALSITLFDALHAHPSLKTLEMGGNSLGEEGLAALDKLKEANPSLDVAVDKNAQDEDGNFNGNQ